VTFRQYLSVAGLQPEKALALTVGTDGLDPKKSHLMSVSLLSDWAEVGTVFVKGANAGAVSTITGVSADVYETLAQPLDVAIASLVPVLSEASFLVLYSPKFMRDFLCASFPQACEKPYLDIIPMARWAESKYPMPETSLAMDALRYRMEGATSHIKGSKGFDAVCARLLPNYDGDSASAKVEGNEATALERKVYKLWALWTTLLNYGG
jgi:hypothetical protein